jgi:nucleoside phosphorylase
MTYPDYSPDQINELIKIKQQRLYYLERQKAAFGLNTPPQVLMEIDELLSDLVELRFNLVSKAVSPATVSPNSYLSHVLMEIDSEIERLTQLRHLLIPLADRVNPVTVSIGIVTVLGKEFNAASMMLDNSDEYFAPGAGAGRHYTCGTMPAVSAGKHRVAVAFSLDMGNNASAIRTVRMLEHFPKMKHVFMVGIAGGVPSPRKSEDHVRLGDVVVSDRNGVVQYDLGKEQLDTVTGHINFIVRTPPRPPSAELLEAARFICVDELRGRQAWLKWLERTNDLPNSARPSEETDVLYETLDQTKCLEHPRDPQRISDQPRVFLGTIGSADRVLKNPLLRDSLRDKYGVKAIEMEGSGVADATWQLERNYLVVRGICDYCDTHKNDVWQEYAAAVAAAYTRGLLSTLPAETAL